MVLASQANVAAHGRHFTQQAQNGILTITSLNFSQQNIIKFTPRCKLRLLFSFLCRPSEWSPKVFAGRKFQTQCRARLNLMSCSTGKHTRRQMSRGKVCHYTMLSQRPAARSPSPRRAPRPLPQTRSPLKSCPLHTRPVLAPSSTHKRPSERESVLPPGPGVLGTLPQRNVM